jgi:hypothetical protein
MPRFPQTPEEWDWLIDETARTGDAAVAMDNLGYSRRHRRVRSLLARVKGLASFLTRGRSFRP